MAIFDKNGGFVENSHTTPVFVENSHDDHFQ
jgi:hypothetical protein